MTTTTAAGQARPAPAADPAVTMLQELGTELDRAGLRARLTPRVPCLTVTNPAAPDLTETIRAAPDPRPATPGGWRFWWSWGEPIPGSLPEAAARITRVLSARH